MLTFQFSLDETDCKNFLEASMLENVKVQHKKPRTRSIIILAVISVILILGDITSNTFPSIDTLLAVVFIVFFLLILMPRKNKLSFLYKRAVANQLKNYVANPDNESFFELKTYMITETGIQASSATADIKIYWKGFVKKKETNTHIFLFNSQSGGFVFPKNKITDLAEFQKILDQRISFHAEVGRDITI